jgi:hypothetical protein
MPVSTGAKRERAKQQSASIVRWIIFFTLFSLTYNKYAYSICILFHSQYTLHWLQRHSQQLLNGPALQLKQRHGNRGRPELIAPAINYLVKLLIWSRRKLIGRWHSINTHPLMKLMFLLAVKNPHKTSFTKTYLFIEANLVVHQNWQNLVSFNYYWFLQSLLVSQRWFGSSRVIGKNLNSS